MPKAKNWIGEVYGRLIVVALAGKNVHKQTLVECECNCGNKLIVIAGSLVTGNTVSCGCYLKERITKHGGWNKGSYNTWRAMMRRCIKIGDKDYPRYGGVNITVCERWNNYLNFVEDMGEPEGNQTLDRIDPYGNYTPENCRWANITTQNRNIRVRSNSQSGYIGVTKVKGSNKWMASISVNGKKYYSNVYSSIESAAKARKELELKYWK